MNPANIIHNRLCGVKRCERSFRIYEVLRNHGLNGKELGKVINVSQQMVSRTINGMSHSSRVLDALRKVGVPEEYLFDPRIVENENLSKEVA